MPTQHDKTGRSLRSRITSPPKGEPWAWLTRDMFASHAWRAMPSAARRVLDRLIIEYLNHAGTNNGEIVCTFTDFEKYGIRRPSIAEALEKLQALGWIDIVERGGSYADVRIPSRYSLTWLNGKFGPASNRWRSIQTQGDARRALRSVDEARLVTKKTKPDTKRLQLVTQA